MSPNDFIFVYQKKNLVIGLVSVHFSIQLAFDGDFMTIGYLAVDEEHRGLGIGGELENHVTLLAKEKGCTLIELFSQAKRTDAHHFYQNHGYSVIEKQFSKML